MDTTPIKSTDASVTTTLLVSGGIFVTLWLYLRIKKAYSFFSDRKIVGPAPIPLLGHIHLTIIKDMGLELRNFSQKYGKIFGIYFGLSPRLVISDPETVQQVCIKDFDAFPDHYVLNLLAKYQDNFLFFRKGDAWRRIRIFISPTFTSGKIRQMYRLMDSSALDLIEILKEQLIEPNGENSKEGKVVNMKELFNTFTLATIANCCYGLKLERSKGEKFSIEEDSSLNQLTKLCKDIFKFNKARWVPEFLGPIKLFKMLNFSVVPSSTFEPLAVRVRQMIRARKNANMANNNFTDYLQMLINANIDDQIDLGDLDSAENHHAQLSNESLHSDQLKLMQKVGNKESKEKKLSEMEIISNAMMLLFVGLETSSSLLSSCVYALSYHPEIQERLFDEVQRIAKYETDDGEENGKKVSFDYDSITTSKYLDAVISETLRHSPIAPLVDRISDRDYHFDKWNFSIPKGTVLFIPIYALHHDPEYWPSPEKFDPERFMPGRKENIVPGSYCPFGQGPRHCVGMRFSLTETKLALARVILDFRFEPTPGLKFPGKRVNGFTPGGLHDPRVVLIRRQ